MPTDSLLISAGDWTLDLLVILALSYVGGESGFLLRGTVFAIANRYGGAFAISRTWSDMLSATSLLCLSVRTLKTITVVLRTVCSDMESLALKLLSTHLLHMTIVAYELWSACALQLLLLSRVFEVFLTCHKTCCCRRAWFSTCAVIFLNVVCDNWANDSGTFMLTLHKLRH